MQIIEQAKSHWPYLLGGVIGVYVVVKFLGARSASASAVDPNSGLSPAQAASLTAANLQQQQMGNSMQLAEDTLNANSQIAAGRNATAFLAAQGDVAQKIGAAAGGLIASLQMPTIAAINQSGAADAAALAAASNTVDTGFKTQATMLNTAAMTQQYTASVISSGERSIAGAYIGGTNATATGQAAAAQAQASIAIAQANASSKTAVAQSQQQASSDNSMLSTVASLAPLALAFL